MSAAAPGGVGLLHSAWRHLPQVPRRAALSRLTAALAPRPERIAPAGGAGLAVAGELGRASGLGEGARLMLRAVQGLDLPTVALRIGDRAARLPPKLMPLVVHADGPGMASALLALPTGVLRGRRVVGYWAWELPVAPPAWRIGRQFVHEVWVPSRFTRDALAPLLGAPPRVVPHPLAACPPAPSRLGRGDFGLPADAVMVLASFSLASGFTRKNPLGMVAAFRAAFANRTDRLLVLRVGDAGHFPADFARIRDAAAGAANIRIDTRRLPADDLHALTASADMVLSLHRAEGFGLVPAEAMLLGVPVIATGWSATMEYMDADSAALVGYRLVPANDPRGVFMAPGACWAEPDMADAVAQLRRLADDRAARQALGQAGRMHAGAALGAGPLRRALDALGGVA